MVFIKLLLDLKQATTFTTALDNIMLSLYAAVPNFSLCICMHVQLKLLAATVLLHAGLSLSSLALCMLLVASTQ